MGGGSQRVPGRAHSGPLNAKKRPNADSCGGPLAGNPRSNRLGSHVQQLFSCFSPSFQRENSFFSPGLRPGRRSLAFADGFPSFGRHLCPSRAKSEGAWQGCRPAMTLLEFWWAETGPVWRTGNRRRGSGRAPEPARLVELAGREEIRPGRRKPPAPASDAMASRQPW